MFSVLIIIQRPHNLYKMASYAFTPIFSAERRNQEIFCRSKWRFRFLGYHLYSGLGGIGKMEGPSFSGGSIVSRPVLTESWSIHQKGPHYPSSVLRSIMAIIVCERDEALLQFSLFGDLAKALVENVCPVGQGCTTSG
jgi:hypothetical protein